MSPTETAALLRQLNGWRRDFEDKLEQPDSREISEAIDAAIEMIERLESAEKERDNANAAAVNIALEAERLQCEIDNLLARVEAMEKQEPVAWMQSTHLSSFKNRLCGSQSSYVHCSDHQLHPDFKPLYALPGAQPAPSVPVVTPKMEQAFYEKVEVTTVGSIRGLADGIKAAMLAAAPEAKS